MKSITRIVVALGAGLAIGGLLGVLFAPRKGKETREKIAEEGSKLKTQLADKLKWGKQKVAEQLSKTDRQVDELI